MKIRLRMFAILRERSGISEAEIELADGATVAVAMEEVERRFGRIADLLPRTAAAVNLRMPELRIGCRRRRVGTDPARERRMKV